MGPVGQIVKILFYMFLVTELVFSVAIYAMATILLCSRIFIPEHVLMHGSIALFLSIVTLSVIHRGFNALAHDCPFHLYWFAVILIVLLLIQFLFEMFGIRETSRSIWYRQQALPIQEDSPSDKFDLGSSVENLVSEVPNKMEYRVPTKKELEDRKHELYDKNQELDLQKKKKSVFKKPITYEEEKEIELPIYHVRKRPYRRRSQIGSNYDYRRSDFDNDKVFHKDRGVFRDSKTKDSNETEERLTNTPLVLVFHGYSFILKMLCIVLSVLTGFMYQLEYI